MHVRLVRLTAMKLHSPKYQQIPMDETTSQTVVILINTTLFLGWRPSASCTIMVSFSVVFMLRLMRLSHRFMFMSLWCVCAPTVTLLVLLRPTTSAGSYLRLVSQPNK